MSGKKKLGIKTLKYPSWFNLLFFGLTMLVPIILVVIEGMKAPATVAGTTFKVSFMAICIAIITWFFLKKLLIGNMETKLIATQVALEHDYSIDNGNPDKIKYLWYQNEKKLALFNLSSVVLYGGLACIILLGVASTLLKIEKVLFDIMTLYVIAYTIKFMILITAGGGDNNETKDADTTTDK